MNRKDIWQIRTPVTKPDIKRKKLSKTNKKTSREKRHKRSAPSEKLTKWL